MQWLEIRDSGLSIVVARNGGLNIVLAINCGLNIVVVRNGGLNIVVAQSWKAITVYCFDRRTHLANWGWVILRIRQRLLLYSSKLYNGDLQQ